MSGVGDDDALLYLTRPYDYTDPDIARCSTERVPNLASKTQTPIGKRADFPPLPTRGDKKAKNGMASVEKKRKESGGSGDVGSEWDHEMHVITERERRKKMITMFSSLHALLPQLPPKADKTTIVDEAVNNIKHCQQTLQNLQKQKLERLHGIAPNNSHEQTIISTPTLTLDSREAFIANHVALNNSTIGPSNNSKAIMTHRFDVPLYFQTSSSQNVILNVSGGQGFINICAPIRKGLFATICVVVEKHNLDMVASHVTSDLDKMTVMLQVQSNLAQAEIPRGFAVEEVYKQAATEMMYVVSSYCYQI